MKQPYDEFETQSAGERAALIAETLPRQIVVAQKLPGYAGLKNIDAAAIDGREALAALPVLRKSDLVALQQATPPLIQSSHPSTHPTFLRPTSTTTPPGSPSRRPQGW